MGNRRQSQSGYNKHVYKTHDVAYDSKAAAARSLTSIHSPYQTVAVAVGIMVSAWFLTKVCIAFAPLTSVVYAQQYNVSVPVLPSLLDATADELIAGLDAGSFTSLDLVQVRIKCCPPLQARSILEFEI
jgi:hypothetical protein